MFKTDGELLYDALRQCGVKGIWRYDVGAYIADEVDFAAVAAKFRHLVAERDRLEEAHRTIPSDTPNQEKHDAEIS